MSHNQSSSSSSSLSSLSAELTAIKDLLKNIVHDQNFIKEQVIRSQTSTSSSSSSSLRSSSNFNDYIDAETNIESVDLFNDEYTPKPKSSKLKRQNWSPFKELTDEMKAVDESRGNE